MPKRYKSTALAALHEGMTDLHKAGAIGAACLKPIELIKSLAGAPVAA